MAVSLREYRARIKSTESMKKITRAMELISASRIVKAQQRVSASTPYANELTRAVSAIATFSNTNHPLTQASENPKRAAVLIITADRGMAGAYYGSKHFNFKVLRFILAIVLLIASAKLLLA